MDETKKIAAAPTESADGSRASAPVAADAAKTAIVSGAAPAGSPDHPAGEPARTAVAPRAAHAAPSDPVGDRGAASPSSASGLEATRAVATRLTGEPTRVIGEDPAPTTHRPWPIEPEPYEDEAAAAAAQASLSRSPVSASDAAAAGALAAELDVLKSRLRRTQIALGVLAAVVCLLVAAAVAHATGVVGPSASGQVDSVVAGDAAGTDDAADAGDAGQQGSSSAQDEDDASGPGAASDAADDESPDDRLRAADIVEIVGEKWSNAQRILDALGVDQNDLVLITDDGGSVFVADNWTVTLVADLEDSGKVAVHLRHDIEMPW